MGRVELTTYRLVSSKKKKDPFFLIWLWICLFHNFRVSNLCLSLIFTFSLSSLLSSIFLFLFLFSLQKNMYGLEKPSTTTINEYRWLMKDIFEKAHLKSHFGWWNLFKTLSWLLLFVSVKDWKSVFILYVKCSTRESLYIGRGKSNAQVKGVLYKIIYWA